MGRRGMNNKRTMRNVTFPMIATRRGTALLLLASIVLCGPSPSSFVVVDAHPSSSPPSATPAARATTATAATASSSDYYESDYGSRIMRWKRHNEAASRRKRRDRQRPRLPQHDDNDNDDDVRNGGRHVQLRALISELEMTSPIYATMRRSLKEKRHIEWQWQMDRDRMLYAQRRRLDGEGNDIDGGHSSSLFASSSSSASAATTPSTYLGGRRKSTTVILPSAKYNIRRRRLLHDRIQRRRYLEDEFEGAYSTGRPGSTYGYNMFCGSSWADASVDCPSRQNCPSGQSDECVMPGHECWAFTECDTRNGIDGVQFSEAHGVTGAENLAAVGVGAVASGGYVDLSKPSFNETDHSFCGAGYQDAISRCTTHCPSGNLNDCPLGEICFTKTPCDARLMTKGPQPPSPTMEPTTPSPVVSTSKLNKYFCGYDWKDAQER